MRGNNYTDWRIKGKCATLPTKTVDKLFFGKGRRSNKARAFCSDCPVTKQCLIAACSDPDKVEYGLWAGTTEKDRRRVRKITHKPKPKEKLNLVNVTFS